MNRITSRAFVLSAGEYRETSTLLRVMCEREGVISLVGRGLRSPKSRRGAAAQPFTLANIAYSLREDSTIGTLSGIEVERQFANLRGNLECYAVGSFWLEVLTVAVPPRAAPGPVFDLTVRVLEALDAGPAGSGAVVACWCRLLEELGFALQFRTCARCGGRENLNHFDVHRGGVVCSGCAGGRRLFPVGEGVTDTLARISQEPGPLPGTVPTRVLDSFLRLMRDVLEAHLDSRLRSYEFVEQCFRPPHRGRTSRS